MIRNDAKTSFLAFVMVQSFHVNSFRKTPSCCWKQFNAVQVLLSNCRTYTFTRTLYIYSYYDTLYDQQTDYIQNKIVG